jgi:hypothetical protein
MITLDLQQPEIWITAADYIATTIQTGKLPKMLNKSHLARRRKLLCS